MKYIYITDMLRDGHIEIEVEDKDEAFYRMLNNQIPIRSDKILTVNCKNCALYNKIDSYQGKCIYNKLIKNDECDYAQECINYIP